MTETNARRRGTLRPIEPWERPYLNRLGCRVRSLRFEAGMTQKALAQAARMNPASLRRIELGSRRTRASTLRRIVAGLGYSSMECDAVVEVLIEIVGPALAEESHHTNHL